MKLVRYGLPGTERPGLIDEAGVLRDLSSHVSNIDEKALRPEGLAALRALDPLSLPEVRGRPRLGPCVGRVGKFLAIALNYPDHAVEIDVVLPEELVVFSKATSCISGPNDPVQIPRGSQKTDWEVELGVVIGTTARYVTTAQAMSHVAGYCVINDVSERDFQTATLNQWIKGKSHDSFGPIGPWLVTADEVPDPQALDMWLDVNGTRMQSGSTAEMHFGVAEIISQLSRFMTLLPGDVVSTGTPPGVGMGRTPPVFLREGDVMELSVEGLGVQQQTAVQA